MLSSEERQDQKNIFEIIKVEDYRFLLMAYKQQVINKDNYTINYLFYTFVLELNKYN